VVFACARDLRFCYASLRPEDPAKGSPVLVVPACDTAPYPRLLSGNPRFPYPGHDPRSVAGKAAARHRHGRDYGTTGRTHERSDHAAGLDDLVPWPQRVGWVEPANPWRRS
jgi:hypothetical protein